MGKKIAESSGLMERFAEDVVRWGCPSEEINIETMRGGTVALCRLCLYPISLP